MNFPSAIFNIFLKAKVEELLVFTLYGLALASKGKERLLLMKKYETQYIFHKV